MIKQFKLPALVFIYFLYVVKTFLFVTLFEENKRAKLSLTLLGFWDGCRNKMGKKE